MKILHITPHLGGGVGTVILGWMEKVKGHKIACLDYANEKAKEVACRVGFPLGENWGSMVRQVIMNEVISESDIVIIHLWDHPMLNSFLSQPLPACRLIFWCHKHYDVPDDIVSLPDLFLDTSPVQGHGRHIWSTRNMDKFLDIQPVEHKGFNVGYIGTVDYKKLHHRYFAMCEKINIPDVSFTITGASNIGKYNDKLFVFNMQVDDVAPILASTDVFGYPLRPDHYGTCEQALGEAMAAGVVPVVMRNKAESLIVEDGISGFLANSEREYIGLVEFLYKYPSIRESMSFIAREKAGKLYSIDSMVRKWEGVFDDIMEQPKNEIMVGNYESKR